MACREYKDMLSAYIDDELKPLTRLRVEYHLGSAAGPTMQTAVRIKRLMVLAGSVNID